MPPNREFAHPTGLSEKKTVQAKLGASAGTDGICFESLAQGAEGNLHSLNILFGSEDPVLTMPNAPGRTVYFRNAVGNSFIYQKQGLPTETNGAWVKGPAMT